MTDDVGAHADAEAAVAALHAVVEQAQATMALAIADAPIDAPEHAATHHDRPPGELKASARLVLIVNETPFDGPGAETSAAALIRELALARRLYRVDAEIRFETEYARHQHDRLQFKHEHGGKAKYLEYPIQIAAPLLHDRLTQAMT